jgi:FkbM family methyltransferase
VTASNNLKITPLLLLVLCALIHASACLSDLHLDGELAPIERPRTYFYDSRVSSRGRMRRDALYHFQSPLVRELKQLFSNVKRIAALIGAFIGFIALVRNWYVPLFIRLSPFAAADAETLITTRNGLRYVLRPKRGDLSILNEILGNDLYSQWPANGTVVDIGAHVGVFAIQASASSDAVICYEPHPSNFELLQKNIAINALNNVKALQLAVSEVRGIKGLSVSKDKSYGHTFYPNARGFVSVIDVESVTLADVLTSNGLDHIDFLKMHCEGAEFDILTHTSQDVLDRIGTIIIKYDQDGTKIADELIARGFVITWGKRGTLCAVNNGINRGGIGRKYGKDERDRVLGRVPHRRLA